ncbi:GGT1 [Auxenochlorella protothecoides x Auxenochlorella symbiontica]
MSYSAIDRQTFELQMGVGDQASVDGWLEAESLGDDRILSRSPTIRTRIAATLHRMRKWRSGVLCVALLTGLIALTLVTVFVGGRYSMRSAREEVPNDRPAVTPKKSSAPEGSITGDFSARHDYRGHPRAVSARRGVVAADHGRCSDMGVDTLRRGGNAVDAAVTTTLCQGVMNPAASGLGGGAFILVRLANGSAEFVDAREVAPAAANETMFKDRPDAAITGGLAVAVPMELQGLHSVHSRHGALPWSDVVAPVVPVAAKGFPAHPYLVAALGNVNQSAVLGAFPAFRDAFFVREGGGWRAPRVNETCCARPALARLLERVAKEGPGAMYEGETAAGLVLEIAGEGGVVSEADLAGAQATLSVPSRERVLGLEFWTPGPPTSALTITSALRILAGYDLPLAGSGALGMHRTVESMKHAFAARMSLGDPGPGSKFLDVDPVLQDLRSPSYADALRDVIRDDGVLNLTEYGGRWNVTAGAHGLDAGTSHLSVVDDSGMAVSLTTTINTGFGSKILSPSTGILLNNQMADFSTPGQFNVFGYPPSPSNFIRPGKKPFSSMSPLIVEQDGKLRVCVGGSGGPRIISAVLQTVLRLVAYGEPAFDAVANPRLHHQLVPSILYAENWSVGGISFNYSTPLLADLAAHGHDVQLTNWGAVVQAVVVDPVVGVGQRTAPTLHGVSDPRKDGAPSGW